MDFGSLNQEDNTLSQRSLDCNLNDNTNQLLIKNFKINAIFATALPQQHKHTHWYLEITKKKSFPSFPSVHDYFKVSKE